MLHYCKIWENVCRKPTLRRLAGGIGLTAVLLAGGSGEPASRSEELRRHLQETLVRLFEFDGIERKPLVQAYWAGFRIAATAEAGALEREFGEQLWSIAIPPLLKLDVTHEAVSAVAVPGAWRVVQGKPLEIPVVVRNRVGADLELTAEVAGVQRWRLRVPASGTRAFFLKTADPLPAILPLEFGGSGSPLRLDVPLDRLGPGRLAVRIEGPDGGPVAARCYLAGADGRYHVPEGAIARATRVTGEVYFYADGGFSAELPEGDARIELVRGFELEPESRTVAIQAGRTTQLTVRLRRRIDLAARGWYSGDVHVHANLADNEFIQPHDVEICSRGEDLNVTNLLVSNSGGRFDNPRGAAPGSVVHDRQYFSGRPHALSSKSHIMVWNQEIRSRSLYGHLTLLGLRSLLEPPGTGWPSTRFAADYPPNYVLARRARAQGGLVSYSHPAYVSGYQPPGAAARELPVDAALGEIDAFELFCTHEAASLELYYRLLGCGFRLPVSAGTDAFLNYRYSTTMGGERVYVLVQSPFGYEAWVEGLRAGRSFATNGPILLFAVDGRPPGARIALGPGRHDLKASLELDSRVPITRVEIVANGVVAASADAPAGGGSWHWTGTIQLDRSAWLAARAYGPPHRLIVNVPNPVFGAAPPAELLLAHTSPVYVEVGSRPIASASDAAFLRDWVVRLMGEVRELGSFDRPEDRSEVLDLFERARQVYARIASGDTAPR